MVYLDREYIEESRAKELFEEYFNATFKATDILIGCFSDYETYFTEWLHDNDYYCDIEEYDPYANGDYE